MEPMEKFSEYYNRAAITGAVTITSITASIVLAVLDPEKIAAISSALTITLAGSVATAFNIKNALMALRAASPEQAAKFLQEEEERVSIKGLEQVNPRPVDPE